MARRTANRFGRTAKGTYAPDGFCYELKVPLAAMEAVQTKNDVTASSKQNGQVSASSGRVRIAHLLERAVLEQV
jgi:hypothetical protein